MANKPAIETTWETMVRQADPDYDAKARNEVEFRMSNGREFRANRDKEFPYDQEAS